jgi:hypothetical protein
VGNQSIRQLSVSVSEQGSGLSRSLATGLFCSAAVGVLEKRLGLSLGRVGQVVAADACARGVEAVLGLFPQSRNVPRGTIAAYPIGQQGRQPISQQGRQPITQPGRQPITQPGRQPIAQPGRQPPSQFGLSPGQLLILQNLLRGFRFNIGGISAVGGFGGAGGAGGGSEGGQLNPGAGFGGYGIGVGFGFCWKRGIRGNYWFADKGRI